MFMYWLLVPSIVLGAVAIALGIKGRKHYVGGASSRDLAVSAIALGIMAILLTPAVNVIAQGEAEYGRKCALNPEQHDC